MRSPVEAMRDKAMAEIAEAQEEQYNEMLRRHKELISELQNILAAVKELTALIRNTR